MRRSVRDPGSLVLGLVACRSRVVGALELFRWRVGHQRDYSALLLAHGPGVEALVVDLRNQHNLNLVKALRADWLAVRAVGHFGARLEGWLKRRKIVLLGGEHVGVSILHLRAGRWSRLVSRACLRQEEGCRSEYSFVLIETLTGIGRRTL